MLNVEGINLIKSYEALRLKSYHCQAGKCTIGYGATYYEDKTPVKITDEITKERAEELFNFHVFEREKAIEKLVKVKLNSNQFSVLVSFTFNSGVEAFATSTMLKHINAGELSKVPYELAKWVWVTNPKTKKKEKSNGLIARRIAEINLWYKEPKNGG